VGAGRWGRLVCSSLAGPGKQARDKIMGTSQKHGEPREIVFFVSIFEQKGVWKMSFCTWKLHFLGLKVSFPGCSG